MRNLISSRKLNGVSPVEMQVFTDSRHWVGRASIKETSLKASNGERFKTLNSLLIISSCLFEIKSPTRKIPFSARFRKYTDLSPTQINLLFHKITFDKSFPFKSCIFKLFTAEHLAKNFEHSFFKSRFQIMQKDYFPSTRLIICQFLAAKYSLCFNYGV